MAKDKSNGAVKFPVKKAPSEAELSGEYVVPVEQQASVRELDKVGAEIQKALGATRQDYLAREANLMRQFMENRQAYEKTVSEVAKNAGIDLKAAAENRTPWTFDLNNMTFRRGPAKSEPAAQQTIQ
jgi:hypothetical protein